MAIPGTGSAGMEAGLSSLLEPGDTVVMCIYGYFCERMVDMASRVGANVVPLRADWGKPFPEEMLEEELKRQSNVKLVTAIHAETSTGVAQPVREVARAARAAGALVVLDCVTSLSGMDVRFDDWEIDAAYSGTQKCLSCPPGLAPIAFGPRALERLERRRRPVQSWYLDLSLIGRYFGEDRVYHHTAPVNMIFALHAALERVLEEGLERRFARHREAHEALVRGLQGLGFEMLVEPAWRLTMLNAVIPPVDDEASLRRRLLLEHGIEIGGGLGKLAGRIWRIGLMGENARLPVVERLLDVLRELLPRAG